MTASFAPSPSRRRFTLCTLGIACLSLAGTARADTLDEMVDFDGLFIPALFTTGQAATDTGAAPRARAATTVLVTRWPSLRARLADAGPGAPGAAGWQQMLVELDRRISEGDARVRTDRFAQAHESLEHVRPAMLQARRAAGIDYFVDRLVEFHDPMERLAEAAMPLRAGTMTPAGRAELVSHFARTRAGWARIEASPVDPVRHRLSPRRLEQHRRGIADETAALSRLSDALRASSDTALADALAGIKPPFIRAYTAFGFTPEESTAG